jgi:hypothetical protein
VTGKTIPPVTPPTERTFLEAIDTLTFPSALAHYRLSGVFDHLKADRYDLFEGGSSISRRGALHGRRHWNANKTAPRSGNPDFVKGRDWTP